MVGYQVVYYILEMWPEFLCDNVLWYGGLASVMGPVVLVSTSWWGRLGGIRISV